jgi:hypothetical protein
MQQVRIAIDRLPDELRARLAAAPPREHAAAAVGG